MNWPTPPAPMAVIVAFFSDDHLGPCIAALGRPDRVVVVDNGGSDATRAIVDAAGARYVRSPGNIGFARAVNLALAQLDDVDVLLLNPDARIAFEAVADLQRAMHDPQRRLAAVGPSLVGEGGLAQQADWPLPSPGQVWADAVMLGRFWRGRRFVTGAVLLLRADALAELGGLDERYFLYAEESDWQLRAQRAGWDVAVVPSVTATHVGGASSSDSEVRERHFHASGRLFALRWYGRGGAAVMQAGSIVAALRRCVIGSAAARRSARMSLRLTVANRDAA